MDGSFRDDVGVEAVAEVNRIDIVTVEPCVSKRNALPLSLDFLTDHSRSLYMIVKKTWRKRLTAFISTASRYNHASPDILRFSLACASTDWSLSEAQTSWIFRLSKYGRRIGPQCAGKAGKCSLERGKTGVPNSWGVRCWEEKLLCDDLMAEDVWSENNRLSFCEEWADLVWCKMVVASHFSSRLTRMQKGTRGMRSVSVGSEMLAGSFGHE